MEWTEIILAVLSGTTVGGVYEAVKYRREMKQMRRAEAKNADTDAQDRQMDLAEKYLEKVLALTEKGNDNQDKMLERLDKLSEQTALLSEQNDKQDALLRDVVDYLNGDFQQYLTAHHLGKKGKKEGGGK